jgi:hypothetical protein
MMIDCVLVLGNPSLDYLMHSVHELGYHGLARPGSMWEAVRVLPNGRVQLVPIVEVKQSQGMLLTSIEHLDLLHESGAAGFRVVGEPVVSPGADPLDLDRAKDALAGLAQWVA